MARASMTLALALTPHNPGDLKRCSFRSHRRTG